MRRNFSLHGTKISVPREEIIYPTRYAFSFMGKGYQEGKGTIREASAGAQSRISKTMGFQFLKRRGLILRRYFSYSALRSVLPHDIQQFIAVFLYSLLTEIGYAEKRLFAFRQQIGYA